MAQSTVTVLEKTPTGSILLVWNGVFSAVQFNCSCLEANKYCHGMCCTSRVGFSVELEEDEYGLYKHEIRNGVRILATEKGACVYFNRQEGLCSIHELRPKMCKRWHCSPTGEIYDTRIERRDAGWQLVPVRKEEADFVQLRRDNG